MKNTLREVSAWLRVAGLYLIFGLLWIYTSDVVVTWLAASEEQRQLWQTYKGSAFVVVSAVLIAFLVRSEVRHRFRVQKLFRQIVDLAPDPLFIREAGSDEINEANERFADEIGEERSEIIGRSLSELSIDLRENTDDDLNNQLESEGAVDNYRQTFETARGREVDMLISSCRVSVEQSDFICTVANDITELEEAYDQTIQGWARALELRDDETFAHTLRVTHATVALADSLNVLANELIHVRRGALLHDIGKIGVPDRILLKDADLTDEEWRTIKRHPEYARQLLEPIDYLRPAIDIPYRHHEKWDGSGYPDGLSGEAIPLAARIFAVVDVWDALRSDRPYRDAWSEERVLDHLESEKGSHFQPEIVEAFLEFSREERRKLRDVSGEEQLVG